jgi:PAS domain S-box-containing protein
VTQPTAKGNRANGPPAAVRPWRRALARCVRADVLAPAALGVWIAAAWQDLVASLASDNPGDLLRSLSLMGAFALVFWLGQRDARRHAKAERDLRRSEARLRDMAQASSDWQWEMGPDLRFTHFSGQVADNTEEETRRTIGKTRFEQADMSLAPELWLKHGDDLANRRPFRDFIYPWRKDDGSIGYCKISGQPFYDLAGRFAGYRGTGSDVTAQKQAEQALSTALQELRESEAKFRSLVSNLPGVVYRCLPDTPWTVLYCSDRIEETSGYPAREFAEGSRTPDSLILPEDRAETDRIVREAVAKRVPFAVEYRIQHRDGSTRWIYDRGQAKFDAQGKALFLDGVTVDITERKAAEIALAATDAELRASETRFRSLVNNIPGAVYRCLYDKQWTDLFLSDAVTDIIGYPASDFIGNKVRSFASVTHPDDVKLVEDVVADAVSKRTPVTIEYRLIHRDGSVRWVYERAQPIYDINGACSYIDGVIIDITHRKLAEAALQVTDAELRKSEAKFRSLVAHIPGAVYRTCGETGRELFLSEQIEEICGYSAQELLDGPLSCMDVIHPDDRARMDAAVATAVTARSSYVIDYRIIHRDGSIRWLQDKGQAVFDDKGQPLHFDGIVFDITDLKKAEAALAEAVAEQRESDAKFRTLVANSPGAVYRCLLDENWSDVFVSEAIEDLTGYTATEFTERRVAGFGALVHPADRPYVDRSAAEAIEKRTAFVIEYRIFHRDGSIRWVYEKGHPRYDESGSPIYLDGILVDVTDRKLAEDELRRTKDEAESASRAKSEFLATMSHELRTPLNAIIGFSDIMLNERFGPLANARYAEYARDINGSGEHLLELINDILDLSKAEAGKLELHERPVDIEHVIDMSLGMVRSRAENAGIELAKDVAAGLPRLNADERKLRQILLNLLSNAVKFTPADGRVRVSAAPSANGLTLTVEDSGIGIAAGDIPKAMSPFGQVNTPLSGTHTGTGLGLPLTKRLAEMHDARFELRSELGTGTTVTIEFPTSRLINRAA